jgi:hypothetical protein
MFRNLAIYVLISVIAVASALNSGAAPAVDKSPPARPMPTPEEMATYVPQTYEERAAAMQAATEVARTNALVLAEVRRELFEYETKMRSEDEECVKLAQEATKLHERLSEIETEIRARLAADEEWKRRKSAASEAQAEYNALQRRLMTELQQNVIRETIQRMPVSPLDKSDESTKADEGVQ